MYVFERTILSEALGGLDADNAQGEVYLTDVVEGSSPWREGRRPRGAG